MINTLASTAVATPARVTLRRYFPLSKRQTKNPWNLLNKAVLYAHFDTSRTPFMGVVVDVDVVRMQVLVQPDAGQPARFARWRCLTDVIAYVRFD